ncbi:DUF817 family protein [Mucilaginibacter sp. McL0603]|uniref:DUF817 family protein n=1 Tax=Mucilaginibacter sp. McL0603 TaxID=3415670 RepID=UPI003CEF67A5
MLALAHLFTGVIPRYDFMLIACMVIQVVLYAYKIETRDEVLVICTVHLLGFIMEIFKIHIGSRLRIGRAK